MSYPVVAIAPPKTVRAWFVRFEYDPDYPELGMQGIDYQADVPIDVFRQGRTYDYIVRRWGRIEQFGFVGNYEEF